MTAYDAIYHGNLVERSLKVLGRESSDFNFYQLVLPWEQVCAKPPNNFLQRQTSTRSPEYTGLASNLWQSAVEISRDQYILVLETVHRRKPYRFVHRVPMYITKEPELK